MKHSAFYTVVILLMTFGIIIGFLSIPTQEEMTMIYLEREEFNTAKKRLQTTLSKNNNNISSIMPLAMIYLSEANTSEAIKVLEEAVQRQPLSVNFRRALTKLYKDTDNIRSYVKSLKILFTLSPKEKIAHELAEWFYSFDLSDDELKILRITKKKFTLTERELQRYSYLSSIEGDKQSILQLIQELTIDKRLKTFQQSTIEYFIRIGLGFELYEETKELALAKLKLDPKLEKIITFCQILSSANKHLSIQELLELLKEEEIYDPNIISFRYQLLTRDNKKKEAYLYLKNIQKENKLPIKLQKDLLNLSYEYEKDTSIIGDFLFSFNLEEIGNNNLTQIIERAIAEKNTEFQNIIKNKLSKKYLEEHPEIMFAFMISERKNIDEKQDIIPEKTEFSSHQLFFLTRISLALGYVEESKAIIQRIEKLNSFSSYEIHQFSVFLTQLELEKWGEKILKENKEHIPENIYAQAMTVLAASRGEGDTVRYWLKENSNTNAFIIRDLFSVSNIKNHALLGVHIAQSLNNRFPDDPKNIAILALAYAKTGNNTLATSLVQELLSKGIALEKESLLIYGIASKDPQYEKQFADFFTQLWDNNTLSKKEFRETGFQLINQDSRESAALIFRELAKGKSFKDDDVQGLLGAWEKKLFDERISWIKAQSLAAPAKEKYLWLQHLLYSKEPKHVFRHLQEVEDRKYILENKGLQTVYIESAIQLKHKKGMKKIVYLLAKGEKDPKKLDKCASYAEFFGDKPFAASLHEKILKLQPSNYKTVKKLALLYFSMGRFDQSKYYLSLGMQMPDHDYAVYYYYAEIFRSEKCYGLADKYHKITLNKLQRVKNKKIEEKTIEAATYFRLQYHYVAAYKYLQILKEYPENPFIRFELANVWTELEKFCCAKKLLWDHQLVESLENEPKNNQEWIALKVSQIQFLKRVYRLNDAMRILNRLLEKYPDEVSVLMAAADLMNSLGKIKKSLKYLCKNQQIEPYNQNLYYFKEDILALYNPIISTNTEYKKIKTIGQENFYRVFAKTPIFKKDISFQFLLEAGRINSLSILNTQTGTTIPFKGKRYRASIGVLSPFCYDTQLETHLIFSEPNIGIGAHLNRLDYWGRWDLFIEYHKPDWDLQQTFADKGTSDQIQLIRTFQWRPRLLTQHRLLCREYSLEHFKKASASYLYESKVFCQLNNPNHYLSKYLFGKDFLVSWNASYEYENPLYNKSAIDKSGNEFYPILIIERSITRNAFYFEKVFSHIYRIQGHYGWVHNWIENIPPSRYYGIGFSIVPPKHFNFVFLYEYLPADGSAANFGDTDRFFFDLSYIF